MQSKGVVISGYMRIQGEKPLLTAPHGMQRILQQLAKQYTQCGGWMYLRVEF